MNGKTPLQKLQECGYKVDDKFALSACLSACGNAQAGKTYAQAGMFPVLILDDIAPQIICQVPGNDLLAMDKIKVSSKFVGRTFEFLKMHGKKVNLNTPLLQHPLVRFFNIYCSIFPAPAIRGR